MKPNHLIVDRAAEAAQMIQAPKPTQLERRWVKIDGRLECRWMAATH